MRRILLSDHGRMRGHEAHTALRLWENVAMWRIRGSTFGRMVVNVAHPRVHLWENVGNVAHTGGPPLGECGQCGAY